MCKWFCNWEMEREWKKFGDRGTKSPDWLKWTVSGNMEDNDSAGEEPEGNEEKLEKIYYVSENT